MNQPDKLCPKCNGPLTFRLGEFECLQCGFTKSPTTSSPPAPTAYASYFAPLRTAGAGEVPGLFYPAPARWEKITCFILVLLPEVLRIALVVFIVHFLSFLYEESQDLTHEIKVLRILVAVFGILFVLEAMVEGILVAMALFLELRKLKVGCLVYSVIGAIACSAMPLMHTAVQAGWSFRYAGIAYLAACALSALQWVWVASIFWRDLRFLRQEDRRQ